MLQDLFSFFFDPQGFMPHGFCFRWDPLILWITVASDLLIVAAYMSIPAALGYFVYKRKDLQNRWLTLLFSAFIFACGATHLLAAVNVWYPIYGFTAFVKLITAVVSVVTAILLWPFIPFALKIPSPNQLQHVNQELKKLNDSLDHQVYERTRDLLDSQKHLQNIINLSPTVVYILKPTGVPHMPFKVDFISEKIVEIAGFAPEEWYENTSLWVDHLHPEDKERALNDMQELIKDGSVRHEYRFRTKQGEYRWVRDELIVDYDSDGSVLQVYGSWDDISGYKKTEVELLLAATTFESMQAVMITDSDAQIMRVNKAFTEITGYAAEEVIGCKPSMFNSGYQDKEFYRQFWKQLLEGGHYEGELWNRKKNGEVYPVWESITAVKDGNGVITHFVSIFNNISEKKEKELEIRTLAYYDALTKLPNRRLLIDRIEHELSAAVRHRLYGAIIFLDLDDFKLLNDSAGHSVGDQLLIMVANRITQHLRTEDTPARLGGDEFVILLQANDHDAVNASDHAMTVAKKIQHELNKAYMLNNTPMHFTPSIGISVYPDGELSANELIQQADTAMYRSKSRGKNQISYFSREMQRVADNRIKIESQLRTALLEQQLELFFQPQIYRDGRCLSAEALLRWHHPQRGLLLPAEFIHIAEQSDLISVLDLWVISTACDQLAEWKRQNIELLQLSVNISSRLLLQSGFVEKVEKILRKTGADPALLMFEVTERIFIDKMEKVAKVIGRLNEIGISFSVDDFGTGYSSLSYLKTIPFQQLKIDRTFVRDILTDQNDDAIVETIIAMANKLNLQVIAEGVETEQQLEVLKSKGCDLYQGFYFGRPLSNLNFIELLQERGSRKQTS